VTLIVGRHPAMHKGCHNHSSMNKQTYDQGICVWVWGYM